MPVVAWWIWILAGLVLMVGELLTPGGFYLFFFGIGALIVGLMGAVGIQGPLALQLLLFLGFSIGCVAAFRKPLIERRRTSSTLEDTDTLIGSSAIVSAAMKPGEYGKVELRGTTWNAQNIGVVDLQAGQRCRVDEADGLTLKVRG